MATQATEFLVLNKFSTRAYLKKAEFRKLSHFQNSAFFCPDKVAAAGCGNQIRTKCTAKWGVQIGGMLFSNTLQAAHIITAANVHYALMLFPSSPYTPRKAW
ncbi:MULTISPECIES: DUF6783 domain-containing protein [unclassified Ruminococcus]|uniref:DUF6783 domain-containing protein n=1 Tax=unclassified Ruminococcus TaxID=2608920 RepID=UPI00319DA63A